MIQLTKKHHIEAGIVIGLLLTLAGFYIDSELYFKLAFASLFLSLLVPVIFYPFTFVWFNLSQKLGSITSLVLMSVIYFVVVLPVSMVRRISGKDSLSLRKFKKDSDSVFIDRNLTFTPEHIDKTY